MQKWIIQGTCQVCGEKYHYIDQEFPACDKHYNIFVRKRKIDVIEGRVPNDFDARKNRMKEWEEWMEEYKEMQTKDKI